jgi:hypothetical protein
LYLLFQLAGAVTLEGTPAELVDGLTHELPSIIPTVTEVAEHGTPSERIECVELLAMTARIEGRPREWSTWLLARIATCGEDERRAVTRE